MVSFFQLSRLLRAVVVVAEFKAFANPIKWLQNITETQKSYANIFTSCLLGCCFRNRRRCHHQRKWKTETQNETLNAED